MGLFFFKNALEGGDWIIQERLDNDAFVSSLLPENAPLSTMRVISASRSDSGTLRIPNMCLCLLRVDAMSCSTRFVEAVFSKLEITHMQSTLDVSER